MQHPARPARRITFRHGCAAPSSPQDRPVVAAPGADRILRSAISTFRSSKKSDSAKLFPASQKARDVRDRLLDLARRNGARLLMNTTVTGFVPDESGWRIDIHDADSLHADALVVATGGLSVPNYRQRRRRPAHCRISGPHRAANVRRADAHSPPTRRPLVSLSGVSLPVTVTARAEGLSSTATGGFLFTHHGYSGPAILDVSHVAVRSRAEQMSPARVDRAMDDARRRGVVGGAAASGLAHGLDGGRRRDADPPRRSPDRRRGRRPSTARLRTWPRRAGSG